jgi:gamma-glutamylcyclotransferase (GGCT)/AIG2-like uncharacterized protein YtfP
VTSQPTEAASPARLFAYGTLAPGRPNAHVLANVPGTWEPATTTGRLVQDGGGAALGYPALVVDHDTTEVVSGMLLTSSDLDAHWDALDEFEGIAYQRVTVTVVTAHGDERAAQTYVLRSSIRTSSPG